MDRLYIALCRAGIQIFWADEDRVFPHVHSAETASVMVLLGLCLILTLFPAAPWRYVAATAEQIHAPGQYINAVLSPEAPKP